MAAREATYDAAERIEEFAILADDRYTDMDDADLDGAITGTNTRHPPSLNSSKYTRNNENAEAHGLGVFR